MDEQMIAPSAAIEALERNIVEANAPVVEAWKHVLDAPNAPAVKGAYQRYALAKMLDTQQKVLSTKEALQTTTVYGTNYVKAMLGMSRQVFPRMFGTRLVSIQPMDRPTGQIFYLNIKDDNGVALAGGVQPKDSAGAWGYSQYQASRAYSDHSTGEGGAIQRGMAFDITSQNVEVTKAKKLKVSASWELETDLRAYHDLNAMDLLSGAAVDQISYEKDALIVRAVRDAAIANKTVTFGKAPDASWTNGTWSKRLQRAILTADRYINKVSLRQPNVMVVGYDAMTELLDLGTFDFRPMAGWDQGIWALAPVGTMNGIYEVYMSRTIPDNEVLIGRRGAGFLDAGIVYTPYVDLFISDRFFDVETQKTTQSFASRYEIFTMSSLLYARVVIDPNATGIA